VKQQPVSVSAKGSNTQSNNIYDFEDDTENLPTQSEYQSSLRENKIKGQQQTGKELKKRKPAENKENGEKPKEVENKKPKGGKQQAKKLREADKKPLQQQQLAANIPIWQNELIRPLFYVFVFVTLISLLYLVLN
jgi:hypothetical protein